MASLGLVFLVILHSSLVVAIMAVAQQWLRWLFIKLRHNQPGPLPIPILGNLLHLISNRTPHRSFSELARKYGPLFYLQLGIVPTVIVSTPAAAQQVLHVHDKSLASRPSIMTLARLFYGIDKTVAICPYNDQWRWTRKFYSLHMLNARYLRDIHVPIIREEILRALLGDVLVASRAASEVNLSNLFSTLVQNIMYRILLDELPANISTRSTTTDVYTFARDAERLAGMSRIGDFLPFFSFLDRSLNGAVDRCHRTMDAFLECAVTERQKMNKELAPAAFGYSKPPSSSSSSDGKRTHVQKCMLDMMLASDPPMERDQMKAMLTELIIAGTSTTATALEWAMAELLNNERVMRKAVEEVDRVVGKERMVSFEDVKDHKMPYIRAVVKETLRLHPPGPFLFTHFAAEACELKLKLQQQKPKKKKTTTTTNVDGSTLDEIFVVHRIEAGTRVMVNAWAIGRDEETWGQTANQFLPDRFLAVVDNDSDATTTHDDQMMRPRSGQDLGLFPFGSGRRMCPGHMLAMSVLELTIATFLHCFQWKRNNNKENDGPLDMSEDLGLVLLRRSPVFAMPTSFRLPSYTTPPPTIHHSS